MYEDDIKVDIWFQSISLLNRFGIGTSDGLL